MPHIHLHVHFPSSQSVFHSNLPHPFWFSILFVLSLPDMLNILVSLSSLIFSICPYHMSTPFSVLLYLFLLVPDVSYPVIFYSVNSPLTIQCPQKYHFQHINPLLHITFVITGQHHWAGPSLPSQTAVFVSAHTSSPMVPSVAMSTTRYLNHLAFSTFLSIQNHTATDLYLYSAELDNLTYISFNSQLPSFTHFSRLRNQLLQFFIEIASRAA